jgi:hypothetical protein
MVLVPGHYNSRNSTYRVPASQSKVIKSLFHHKSLSMTTIIIPVIRYIKRKIRGVLCIAKIAKKRRLYISAQDELGDNLIAIDSRKRKLLFIRKASPASSYLVIDLKHLQDCTVKKQYGSIKPGDLRKKKLSGFLKSIFLHLHFKNGSEPVSLPLYEEKNVHVQDVEQLEAKARKWQTMVSGVLVVKRLERA